jgi:penicillin-binding protein 1A
LWDFLVWELKFWKSALWWLLFITVIGTWWVLITSVIYLYNFIISQPQYSVYDLPLALPSKIVDKNWIELYTFFDERRVPVSYEAISPMMIDALISAEDKNFWINDGFDPQGIVRSTVVTLKDRRDNGFLWYSQWASTLTQQIIKNTIGGKEKKLSRKLHEIIYAWLLTYNTYAQNKQFFDGDTTKVWEKSKKDIITFYLNSSFFWNHAYGISEAARLYFNTWVDNLSIPQAAILSAIPKSPYFFDPYRYRDNLVWNREISINGALPTAIDQSKYWELFSNILTKVHYPDILTGQNLQNILPTFSWNIVDQNGNYQYWFIKYSPWRKDYVLQRMYEDWKITLQKAIEYMITPIEFSPKPTQINVIKAPHFVHYIKESIINNPSLGINEQQLSKGWYTIMTTLDITLQEELEKLIATDNNHIYKLGATNRAVLITNIKNGEIIWYIWSTNFYNKDIDWEVDLIRAPRQVGSTLKPLIYAYALSQYPFGIDTRIYDTPTNFWWYSPNNADGHFKWYISMKVALAWSRNIPAIKMFNAMWWVKTYLPFFLSLGMNSLNEKWDYGLSMALGTAPISMIDLAQGYTHLSDTNDVSMIHGISKIIDSKWFTIFDHGDFMYWRKIPLWVARLITYMLETPAFAPSYFQDLIRVPWCTSCASKTGTTNAKKNGKNIARDGWLVTYNPDVIITMRAGNTNGWVLWSNAYGFNLNIPLRNSLVKFLTEKELMFNSSHRNYPNGVTRSYAGQGEWYIKPIYSNISNKIKNKL